MRRALATVLGAVLITGVLAEDSMAREVRPPERAAAVALPAPRLDGGAALERALAERRSVREFARGALTLPQVAQLLWAAQGVTQRDGARTAPSAGALYPLELYLVAGAVRELAPGVYRYVPGKHQLEPVAAGDLSRQLCAAALAQECVAAGAAVFVFTAVERRTTRKYGPRGVRYVHIEVGHAAQNLALQATALGLGSVTVGAFDDAAVARLLQLPAGEAPLYLMPVGLR
ncbi:MAG TPA: SagB/ThcOx family dehydrogenase [Acidiferrobacterales bacterium]|nr:SagB/ThcOx family dehydrogenase [Acidiferrobacterales bacterium]